MIENVVNILLLRLRESEGPASSVADDGVTEK